MASFILNIKRYTFLAAVVVAASISGCTPDQHDKDLGTPPDASFTTSEITGRVNTYLLTSTTPGAFHFRWDNGDGSGFREGKAVDTAYFPERGTYTVKLIVLGAGGYDTTSRVINVAADDPNGCAGAKALLTGCSSKTWVLEQPGAGALWVGDPNGGQWWSNSAAEVNHVERTCLFNDRYTFSKNGSFVFDDLGDFRVDDEGGNPWPTNIGLPIGCHATTSIPAQYRAWGSGNHTFRIIGGNKLQVIGTGAHLGLYKAGENGTIAAPEASNTYDILELTATRMVVRKMYSWGQWRFTFKAI
jgi:PKD repeat protein